MAFTKKDSPLRRLKLFIIRLSRDHSTAHEIAFGAALGAFVSIFPTFGAGTFIVLLLYRFFSFNLVSAIGGSMISNFFTSPFFLLLSYNIGSNIWGNGMEIDFNTWYKNLDVLSLSIMTGNIILCIGISLAVYFLMKQAVLYYRKRRGKSQAAV